MCAAAGQMALSRAAMDASEVQLILCATTTPNHLLPATACLVQREIGATKAGAFDVSAGCTGFLSALIAGTQFIRSGAYERVLIVAGETLSRFLNWNDRNSCILFGDGAGAVVLGSQDRECGILSFAMASCGDQEGLLTIKAGGSAHPATTATVAAGDHFVAMRGNEIFRLAIRAMTNQSREVVAMAGIQMSSLRAVIGHQANERILRGVQEGLGLTWDSFILNVDRYGNTGAASVAIALSEYLSGTTVRDGDNILLTVFGGGLTWASVVFRHFGADNISPKLGAGHRHDT
jgi:3-oxoacyl-[acyl-carrier-protein] synthase III